MGCSGMEVEEIKSKEAEEEEAKEEQKRRRQIGLPHVDPDALPSSVAQKNLNLGSKVTYSIKWVKDLHRQDHEPRGQGP